MIRQLYAYECYAVIRNAQGEVLVRQTTDEERQWCLPGVVVAPGNESPSSKLLRRLKKQLGLRLQAVNGTLGGDFHYGVGVNNRRSHRYALTFCCEASSDFELSLAAQDLQWLSEPSAIQYVKDVHDLTLDLRCDGKTYAMVRILLDAFSIGEPPAGIYETGCWGVAELKFNLPISADYQLTDDGLYLVQVTADSTIVWRRLDPFTPSGYMTSAEPCIGT